MDALAPADLTFSEALLAVPPLRLSERVERVLLLCTPAVLAIYFAVFILMVLEDVKREDA